MLLAVLGINVGMALLLDQFRPDRRDPEYRQIADLLTARQVARPDAPLILFLGSSRVALGVDAGELSDSDRLVFNFGMPGAGPYMMNVCWDRIVEAGFKPDVVIIELMHPFYNGISDRTLDHSFLDASRLSVLEARGLVGYGNRSTTTLRRLGIARLFPASRHGHELCETFGFGRLHTGREIGPLEAVPDDFGYRPLNVPESMRENMRQLAHKQYDAYYPNFTVAPDPVNRLRELIGKVRRQGAVVKLLITPEGSEFRNMMSPEMAVAIQDFSSSLQTEFETEIIDARDWLPDTAFYDQHHLLPEGGKLFADRLRPCLPTTTRKQMVEMPR